MIGKIMPALRAVFEGVTGAKITSDSTTAYPRKIVRCPMVLTRTSAILRPSPVRSYAVPNTNAEKASQTVLLLKPDNAHSIARTGVLNPGVAISSGPNTVQGARTATAVTPISPIAEFGSDSRIRPATTPTKIEKKYHECSATSAGGGTKAKPTVATSGAKDLNAVLNEGFNPNPPLSIQRNRGPRKP